MKSLLEEYGLTIFVVVVIISILTFVAPIKSIVKNTLTNMANTEGNVISESVQYINSEQIKEAHILIHNNRNLNEGALRDYSEIADKYKDELDTLEASTSFIAPIENASISAGVWKYPESFGGGVHLGVDYAVSLGTDIIAPANGIIVISSNGCGTGFLGDTCSGNDPLAVSYGGNQIYFFTSVDNKVYCITFSHLLLNSPSKKGIVMQGDKIAKVGSSGNSTGAHSHIEVFYLGEGDFVDIEETYLRTPYSASFNCGWGEAALNNICLSEPTRSCRLNPETIFPE